MTWYGTPSVYKKGDIVVISPQNTTHILDALGFDMLFEFSGSMKYVRLKSKKVMHYVDIFGDTRMARLQRIAMDLDVPLQEYLTKKAIEKKHKAQQRRKKKVVAAVGLVVERNNKEYIVCPYPKCGRRYGWQHPTYLLGRCPRWNSKIELESTDDGKYLIKKLEIDRVT